MKLRRTITEANIAPKILADPRLSKMLVLAMRHDPTIPRTKIAKLGPRATDAELIQLWSDILDDSLSDTKYGDMSRDGKFDAWLTRLYTEHTLNYEDVNGEGGDALGAWKALSIRNVLDPQDQDFNKLKSLTKLQNMIRKPKYAAALKKMEDAERLAKIKRDAKQEILIDDERFTVFVPLNYGSTYYFNNGEGVDASYCTGSSSGQYWFDKYSKDGPIVCILDKKNMDKQKGKWQMHTASSPSQLNDAIQQNDKSKSDEEFSELFPGLMRRIVKELNAKSEELKTKSKDLELARGGWNLAEETARIKRKYPLAYASRSDGDEDDTPVWKIEYQPYMEEGGAPDLDPVYIRAEEKYEAFIQGTQALNEVCKQQHNRGLHPLSIIDVTRGSGDTSETWEEDREGEESSGQEAVDEIRLAAIASGDEPRNWLWDTNEIIWRVTDEDNDNATLGYIPGATTRRVALARAASAFGRTGREADSLVVTPGKRVNGVWQYWNGGVPEEQTPNPQAAAQPGQAGADREWIAIIANEVNPRYVIRAPDADAAMNELVRQVARNNPGLDPALIRRNCNVAPRPQETAQAGENRSWEVVRLPDQTRMYPREFLAAPSYEEAWNQFTQQQRFRGVAQGALDQYELIPNEDAVRQPAAQGQQEEREWMVMDNGAPTGRIITANHRDQAMDELVRTPQLAGLSVGQVRERFSVMPREEAVDLLPDEEEGPEQEWRVTCPTRGVSRNITANSARQAKETVARLTGNTAQLLTNPGEWDARVIPDNRADAQPPNQQDEEREWLMVVNDVFKTNVIRASSEEAAMDEAVRLISARHPAVAVETIRDSTRVVPRTPQTMWMAQVHAQGENVPGGRVAPNQQNAEHGNRDWEVIDMRNGRRLGIHYNAATQDEAFDRFINYMVQEHGANDIDVAAHYNVVPLGQQ